MKPTNSRLQEFVDAGKLRGASDESLVALLTRNGWPAVQVYAAIGNYWEHATGVTLPERTANGESSRDAFLYLLSFAMLATWATALGSLLYQLIDHWLPDPVSTANDIGLRASVTWQMASIVVAFPIYLIVMRAIVRETAADSERLQSGVRKWLTWIALLLTAGSLIGDLICFLDFFLTGELTPRFILKCAVVFVIAGAIFAYYIASVRRKPAGPIRPESEAAGSRRDILFAGSTAAAVIAVLCAGFVVAGTPPVQRKLEADRRRVEDLQGIARAIHLVYDQNHQLAAALNDPLLQRIGAGAVSDPETAAAYEYRPVSASRFELCATFSSSSERDNQRSYYTGATAFWKHSPGRNCFTLDASNFPPY